MVVISSIQKKVNEAHSNKKRIDNIAKNRENVCVLVFKAVNQQYKSQPVIDQNFSLKKTKKTTTNYELM